MRQTKPIPGRWRAFCGLRGGSAPNKANSAEETFKTRRRETMARTHSLGFWIPAFSGMTKSCPGFSQREWVIGGTWRMSNKANWPRLGVSPGSMKSGIRNPKQARNSNDRNVKQSQYPRFRAENGNGGRRNGPGASGDRRTCCLNWAGGCGSLAGPDWGIGERIKVRNSGL